MTPWRTWLRTNRPARPRPDATRARLRLEALEDRTVPSTVWYVNASAAGAAPSGTSWSSAFTDLQSALGAAQAGDQIWVAQGTYKPTAGADRTASFALKDGVAVYGGFAGTETQLSQRDWAHHPTILSGAIGNAGGTTDNSADSYHVVTAANVGATALLEGFTITGGNANGSANDQGRGGGLFADHAAPTLGDLVFIGNAAGLGGGMADSGGAPSLTNVVFRNNTAQTGGALYNDGGSPTLMSATLNGNSGGLASVNGGSATITNSILWGDAGGEISGGATVSHSDVQGGATGTANINADPQFVDAAHGNLHLKPTSPAVDAGTNTGVWTTDLDGRPRPADGTNDGTAATDLGAFEYQPVVVQTLAPAVAQANPTNGATLHFQVVFSQPVTDFVASDVQLGGTAGATAVQVTGSGTTYDLAVTGMTHDGTVTVNIPADAAHDAAGDGNEAWTGTTNQVVYDATPPVTTASLTGTTGNAGWYKGPVQVTLAATDATSGIASTSYKIDGGAAQAYTSPFTVSSDGTHTITFFSVDHAGNTEATKTVSFKVDTTAPVTTANLAGSAGTAGWYKSPVQLTLTTTDATSGVASTSYRIDGGAAQTYTSPFTVSGAGTHTVTFFSSDKAGNVEATKSISFKIDATAPVTTSHLTGTAGLSGWYRSGVQVALAATDATSGVASTSYKIDGGAAHTYTVPFLVTGDGTHTVTFFSVDRAGNVESTKTVTVKIDTTPPGTTSYLYGLDGHNHQYSGDVRVVLASADPTSGVAATFFRVDNGAYALYHGDFFVRGVGQHQVTYYGVDKAGNVEPLRTVSFSIYALPPRLWVNGVPPVNLGTNLRLPVAGVTAAGATVAVTVTDVHGHKVSAATTADAHGLWSIPGMDVHGLADGTLTVSVTATATDGGHTTQVRSTTKSSQVVLDFLRQPSNTPVHHNLFTVVELRDGFGNEMGLSGQAVTLSLASPAPAGTLHGTVTVHTNALGQAEFHNLSIGTRGVYRLQAADGTATATSLPFRIT
jgi:hypothetical protein